MSPGLYIALNRVTHVYCKCLNVHIYITYNMYCNVYTWNYLDTLKTLCKHISVYIYNIIQTYIFIQRIRSIIQCKYIFQTAYIVLYVYIPCTIFLCTVYGVYCLLSILCSVSLDFPQTGLVHLVYCPVLPGICLCVLNSSLLLVRCRPSS